jgi:tRNA (cmo5U34)-methyltransferase
MPARNGIGEMSQKDTLFQTEKNAPGDFVFDDRVVSVFPDMINRSVPGYGLIVPMIGMLARRYAREHTLMYDLGCSLGAVSIAMRAAVRRPGIKIVAIDSSADMIRRLNETLQDDADPQAPEIQAVQQDIAQTPIDNASVIVLNFTLQFLEPDQREGLLRRIASGLVPGGILILSEKIRFEDEVEQTLQTTWHHDFKKAQGYSELEIAQKRDALENVMKPNSMEQHRDRLKSVGFKRVSPWFQGFNFVSMVAFRESSGAV